MVRAMIESMCPFFIVRHVDGTIAFYTDKLGFETSYKEPEEEPFFAIVGRDGASLFVKAGEASPLPNPKRDPAMRWDAYCYTPDPDALAAEFAQRGAPFSNARTPRMACAASRSPTLTVTCSSSGVRERWRSVGKINEFRPWSIAERWVMTRRTEYRSVFRIPPINLTHAPLSDTA